MLSSLKDRPETLVFFESPQRVRAALHDALKILGDRQMVLAKEITKVFEDFYRGKISEVLEGLKEKEIKGEVTLIIGGLSMPPQIDQNILSQLVKAYIKESGLSCKEIATSLSSELPISKREVYKKILELIKENQ